MFTLTSSFAKMQGKGVYVISKFARHPGLHARRNERRNEIDDYKRMKKKEFGWSMEWNHLFQNAFHSLKIIPSTPMFFFHSIPSCTSSSTQQPTTFATTNHHHRRHRCHPQPATRYPPPLNRHRYHQPPMPFATATHHHCQCHRCRHQPPPLLPPTATRHRRHHHHPSPPPPTTATYNHPQSLPPTPTTTHR
ncbi:hypothetical protein HanIR_Chr01g0050341 [Helianthus annuus]|nr:hypothetical protein HanIR_Chr01g0050341 [Helianthus annuus]